MCKKLMFFGLFFLGLGMTLVSYVQAQNYNLSLKSPINPNGLVVTADGLFPGPGTKEVVVSAGGVCTGTTLADGTCTGDVGQVTGAFVCQNNGGNFGWGTTGGPVTIDLEGFKDVTSAVKNGKFRGQIITATVPDTADDTLCAKFGNGWQLHDFAFCGDSAFQVDGNLVANGLSTPGADHLVCNIPGDGPQYSCDLLSAVKKQGIFNGPSYNSVTNCRICKPNGDGTADCGACLINPGDCTLLQ